MESKVQMRQAGGQTGVGGHREASFVTSVQAEEKRDGHAAAAAARIVEITVDVAEIHFVVGDFRTPIIGGSRVLLVRRRVDLVYDGNPLDVASRRNVNDRQTAVIERAALWEERRVVLLEAFDEGLKIDDRVNELFVVGAK